MHVLTIIMQGNALLQRGGNLVADVWENIIHLLSQIEANEVVMPARLHNLATQGMLQVEELRRNIC